MILKLKNSLGGVTISKSGSMLHIPDVVTGRVELAKGIRLLFIDENMPPDWWFVSAPNDKTAYFPTYEAMAAYVKLAHNLSI